MTSVAHLFWLCLADDFCGKGPNVAGFFKSRISTDFGFRIFNAHDDRVAVVGIVGFSLYRAFEAFVKVMLCSADFFCISKKIFRAQVVAEFFQNVGTHFVFPIVIAGSNKYQRLMQKLLTIPCHGY